MALPCKQVSAPNTGGRKKKPFNRDELSDIAKRVRNKRRLFEAAGMQQRGNVARASDAMSRKVEEVEAAFMGEAAELIHLKPNQSDAIGGLWASLLGQTIRGIIDPTLTKSVAGSVRSSILEAGRIAENSVGFASRIEFSKKLGDVVASIRSITKAKGLDFNTTNRLIQETIDVAQLPKLLDTYGRTPGTERIAQLDYQKYVKEMNELGFNEVEIDGMVDAVSGVTSVFDELRTIAMAHGVATGSVGLPKLPTDDFAWRAKDLDVEEGILKNLNSGSETAQAAWTKSRATWHYIPEDDIIAANFLGTGVQELRELMVDPVAFRSFLHDNVTASQLDALVDSGVMSKLPMSSRDVFNYLVRQYELPYKDLNEMFTVDPQLAIEKYSQSLKRSVHDSAMLRTVAHDGVKYGWAVTLEQKASNPELYKDFVTLKSAGGKYLQDLDGNKLSALDSVLVHPIVARQWAGLMDVSMSPGKMGAFAQAWSTISSSLDKSILLAQGPLYPGRIFLSNMVSGVAGGMNPSHLLPAYFDMVRSSKGLDFLDNTKTRFEFSDGSKYTEQEMFKKLLIRRNVEIAPLSGSRIQSARFDALNPKNIGKALNYAWHYTNAFGTPWSGERAKRGTEYIGNLLGKQLDESFAPIGAFTQQLDVAFRWATAKSFRGGEFKDFDQMLSHLDNHFYMFDDTGALGKATKSVQSFVGYSLQNTPAMIRFALRSPQKFIAYNRIIQLQNQEHIDPNNPPPEAGFRSDDLNKYPILLQKDGNEYTTLIPTNYDPILDAFTFLDSTSKFVQRTAFGQYTGTSEEQRKQAMGKGGWQDLMRGILSNSRFSGPVNVLTGYDPFSDRTAKSDALEAGTNFLGLKMSPFSAALLSIIPPLEVLDRMNPGEKFGLREQRNEYGEVTRQGKVSYAGVPRDRADAKIGDTASKDWRFTAMRQLGMNVKVINTAVNMQSNYADIESSANEIRGTITNAQKDLKGRRMKGEVSEQEYAMREAQIEEAVDKWLQLKWDMGRIKVWGMQNKVPERDVIRRLRDAGLAADELPMPGASKTRQLIDEAAMLRGLK